MEKTLSNRGIKGFYWAVSACFFVLAAWLYCKEGPYVKVFDIQVIPKNGRVQVELLADGDNLAVSAGDGKTKLFVDRQYEEDKIYLQIYGEWEEERTDPVSIHVVSDSDTWRGMWDCRVLAGTRDGESRFTAEPNKARKTYLWVSGLTVMLLGFGWFGGEKDKLQKDLEAYSSRVMEKLEQEPGMEQCCREGKRLFVWYEGQRVLMLLLMTWLWVFFAFGVVKGVSHGTVCLGWAFAYKVTAVAGIAAALKVLGTIRWGVLSRAALVRDCRPVTAAVAYLLMGSYGIEKRRSRFLLYHNGASGLYRSGHCKEALEISDMAWQMLPKKRRDYIAYVHSSLRYQCLKVLEDNQAAMEEEKKMEMLRERNPGWKRRKGIQRFLGIQDICRWIETGEIERAERSAGEILRQWKEGYYRLPVLGLMAELKEFLGKEEEAAGLREEILAFSPENKEVRQVMGAGRLSYRMEEIKPWDLGLLAVYGVCAGGILFFIFFFTL